MQIRTPLGVIATAVAVALAAGCDGETVTFKDRPFAVLDSTRSYNQVERLGNPLVSEVLLKKRDHGFHNKGTPSTDVANFKAKIDSFVTQVAGRTQAHANLISGTLLPDMIVVNTGAAANTAGYLGYVFTPGAYGGRKLTDDVVDASLMAVFGTLVTNDATGAANCAANLCSDFAAQTTDGGRVPATAFPYLLSPNAP